MAKWKQTQARAFARVEMNTNFVYNLEIQNAEDTTRDFSKLEVARNATEAMEGESELRGRKGFLFALVLYIQLKPDCSEFEF